MTNETKPDSVMEFELSELDNEMSKVSGIKSYPGTMQEYRDEIDRLRNQLEEMNKNCISLFLHEQRMEELRDQIAVLSYRPPSDLMEEIKRLRAENAELKKFAQKVSLCRAWPPQFNIASIYDEADKIMKGAKP